MSTPEVAACLHREFSRTPGRFGPTLMPFLSPGNRFASLVPEWRAASTLGHLGSPITHCLSSDHTRFLRKLWPRRSEPTADCDTPKSYTGGKAVGSEERKDWLKLTYDGGSQLWTIIVARVGAAAREQRNVKEITQDRGNFSWFANSFVGRHGRRLSAYAALHLTAVSSALPHLNRWPCRSRWRWTSSGFIHRRVARKQQGLNH